MIQYAFKNNIRLLLLSTYVWLIKCTPNVENNCIVRNNTTVTGIVLVEENLARDGRINILFFPVCNLDTTNTIIQSLSKSKQGFLLSVYQDDISNALKKRKIKLTRVNPKTISFIYATTVIAKIYDIDESEGKPLRDKPFTLNLKTKELVFSKTIYPIYCKKPPEMTGIN